MNNAQGKWEKRWHPLRQEWVVYAAHRNSRPWTTPENEVKPPTGNEYDETCYLCPGNKRVHGEVNPSYSDVFIFDNDHPVVGLNAPNISHSENGVNGVFVQSSAQGIARVVCYDPRHNVSLPDVNLSQVVKVFKAWRDETARLRENSVIKHVQIFENKGELCGVSNPHPHCQIYATNFVFRSLEEGKSAYDSHYKKTGGQIYDDIIASEIADGRRIISENKGAIGFIPFFARYAYETMIFPRQKHNTLITMTDEELEDLAAVFHSIIKGYDKMYNMSFPYVMTIQQAPFVDGYEWHHLHLSILPPLRRPGLIKYLGGPESGSSTFMADTMPEEKARELKAAIMQSA